MFRILPRNPTSASKTTTVNISVTTVTATKVGTNVLTMLNFRFLRGLFCLPTTELEFGRHNLLSMCECESGVWLRLDLCDGSVVSQPL